MTIVSSRTAAPKPKPTLWYEDAPFGRPRGGWRLAAYRIIFESDTQGGRIFDLTLIALIIASVAVVMLDSVEAIGQRYRVLFDRAEFAFTVLFTIEYVLRLCSVRRPLRYATSFFGLVDLLAVMPSYLALFFPEASALINIRMLRLLRIFRILKLVAYIEEFRYLGEALRESRRKIAVFLATVLMIVVVSGTLVYLVERPENGFTSIPTSVYWAITTVTTVGFGDIAPKTDFGRFIASFMMLLGWGILAVPTGIVSAEMTTRRWAATRDARRCASCGLGGHETDAKFCKHCGSRIDERGAPPT
ncbi:MAG TPA: ion transporter [Casimicrobiaceae bacterium]|nr:ion transporter [Casimicrobiaceae bacterium]